MQSCSSAEIPRSSPTWTYIGVTQHILGIRAKLEGPRIGPCLPEGWGSFQVMQRFRSMDRTITVVSDHGVATFEGTMG